MAKGQNNLRDTTFETYPVLLTNYLQTHCIPVPELHTNDFTGFIKARQKLLLERISRITGHAIPTASAVEEGDDIPANIAHDSGLELIEVD
ncbi:hypothetical protein [Nitrosospira multiformis]|uniref:Uncharacterized protein n=1 Tax=Nitrosospira multiformis TaxID=1231 RepID=A0A1I7HAL5_9PROT|nr:hypothetical protein [Nitrosospira multiformis]SFU57750.1 hypothetical protein SAMN05216417_1084 [Nitrosospira multiformis]